MYICNAYMHICIKYACIRINISLNRRVYKYINITIYTCTYAYCTSIVIKWVCVVYTNIVLVLKYYTHLQTALSYFTNIS